MRDGYQEQRERIVESVEQNRIALRSAVQDLRANVEAKVQHARQQVSLSHHIAAHPAPWLVGGFSLGLLLGTRKWLRQLAARAGF